VLLGILALKWIQGSGFQFLVVFEQLELVAQQVPLAQGLAQVLAQRQQAQVWGRGPPRQA
jgi:hypothetical protein